MEKRRQGVFYFEGQAVPVVPSSSVLDCLLQNKIDIDHSCGGFATCGTCRVIVEKDVENLPPRNEVEAHFIEDRNFGVQERLACQLDCVPGLEVSRPHFFKMKKGFE